MNLHDEIMNIRCTEWIYLTHASISHAVSRAYKEGHRDARHAADELALKGDAEINRLRSLIKERERLTDDELMKIYRHVWGINAGVIDFARIVEAKSTAKAEAEIMALRIALSTMVEYGYDLQGEWAWKRGEVAGNADEYCKLEQDIEKAKSYLNSNK